MIDVIFRPEAEEELFAAYRWYEEKHAGLGEEFLRCVEAVVEQISRFPEGNAFVHREIRRGLTRRFPYGVFYIVEDEKAVVLAVFHASRNPPAWRRRRR